MINPDYDQYIQPDFVKKVIGIAKAAGAAIMQVYSTDFSVVKKDDDSPLTHADLAAHHIIVSSLNELTPHLPILSEESESIPYETRKNWPQYWLIDPLDGTREFVKRNGEFTVNIALIIGNKPVLGIVYAPVIEVLYFASHGNGAYKQLKNEAVSAIHTKVLNPKQPIIAGSRSHTDEKMQRFIQNVNLRLIEQYHEGKLELISLGSSLKICLVAEGIADVYPRLGTTCEWDTAAAHCVLTEAGGDIVDIVGLSLTYTKSSLINPCFFAKSGAEHNWASYL
ncbi:MAG TPA: 3'(2'),5'-bisphosphate nucleotidase CysQ [Methylotenera sp.]|nr:3'(2'),5'-bisphosphate nucleotidase CysQ [Methylotenera sp.]